MINLQRFRMISARLNSEQPLALEKVQIEFKMFKDIDAEQRMMKECIICMDEFKEEDMIDDVTCDKRHYFHSKCLSVWLKTK